MQHHAAVNVDERVRGSLCAGWRHVCRSYLRRSKKCKFFGARLLQLPQLVIGLLSKEFIPPRNLFWAPHRRTLYHLIQPYVRVKQDRLLRREWFGLQLVVQLLRDQYEVSMAAVCSSSSAFVGAFSASMCSIVIRSISIAKPGECALKNRPRM